MNAALFASVALATLRAVAWRAPSVCPYCPGGRAGHWIRWGFYERYAEGCREPHGRIRVQRFFCLIVERSFSLLPDSLLPYRFFTASHILRWLYALVVEKVALDAVARGERVARGTLRNLRRAFLRTVRTLRLTGRAAASEPPAFLSALAHLGDPAVADLFRDWKQREPKHSVLGFHPR
ncbi:MAG: hypothetical protein AAB253_06615 [candidate division NC10 bacterium]